MTAPVLRRSVLLAALGVSLTCGLAACSGDEKPATDKAGEAEGEGKAGKGKAGKAKAETKAPVEPPTPQQDAITGEPTQTLFLSQAWFWRDENNKPKPGPARLQIWRKGDKGTWTSSLLEDGESNVFHKAMLQEDGTIVTIGAEGAKLKSWTRTDDGWSSETLYENSWGGQFNRLRDIEMGDVDGDGEDEWVIATHDAGVITVYEPDTKTHVEMDQKADTFVHEIEIGDHDGDGKLEFFATPSDRNKANQSQHGEIVMYQYDGSSYVRSIVDPGEGTHAKEILAADIDNDGKSEIFGVMEAVTDAQKKVTKPVTIRQYVPKEGGGFDIKEIATIEDRQTRFLVPGDFDGDGELELVAAAMKTGIYLLDSAVDEETKERTWTSKRVESDSSGFEHATIASDLDGDGVLELYVASDDQKELRKYTWDAEKKTFKRELLGRLEDQTITWNIEAGTF